MVNRTLKFYNYNARFYKAIDYGTPGTYGYQGFIKANKLIDA